LRRKPSNAQLSHTNGVWQPTNRIFVFMIIVEFLRTHWTILVFVAFCLTTAAQLFYLIYFFARLAFFKSTDKFQSQTHAVSVVVCARDEAHNLEKNLPAVLTQQYNTTHEVVLVNDNSFDDTKFFAEELGKIFKQLNTINLTQEAKHIPGKKYPLKFVKS
jgi:cellulose synthase/poly-beta-1,6-N-acetylglucosamine synthase-like glycosyltransferase